MSNQKFYQLTTTDRTLSPKQRKVREATLFASLGVAAVVSSLFFQYGVGAFIGMLAFCVFLAVGVSAMVTLSMHESAGDEHKRRRAEDISKAYAMPIPTEAIRQAILARTSGAPVTFVVGGDMSVNKYTATVNEYLEFRLYDWNDLIVEPKVGAKA
jgi:hypothetical protein